MSFKNGSQARGKWELSRVGAFSGASSHSQACGGGGSRRAKASDCAGGGFFFPPVGVPAPEGMGPRTPAAGRAQTTTRETRAHDPHFDQRPRRSRS